MTPEAIGNYLETNNDFASDISSAHESAAQ